MIFKHIHKAHTALLRHAQTHPKTMVLSLFGGTLIATVVLFRIIDGNANESERNRGPRRRRPSENKNQINTTTPTPRMSVEEAQLRAMVEDATTAKSWTENIETAVNAQEQFMFPGRPNTNPESQNFIKKINKRSLELQQQTPQNTTNSRDDDKTENEQEPSATQMSYWK